MPDDSWIDDLAHFGALGDYGEQIRRVLRQWQ
jgi:hypothetical protein